MHLLTWFVVLAALVSLSLATPSTVPVCYVCPASDNIGHTLKDSSSSANKVTCTYQTSPKKTCQYDTGTGALDNDKDDGNCPSTATYTCNTGGRKRSALPRSPRPPQPGARSIPSVMKTRAQLGKSKRNNKK